MNVKTVTEDNGRVLLQLDVYDLLHDVASSEQRAELIESLSCAEDVIDHVMSLVLTGCTRSGFSGLWTPTCNSAIQRARNRIAKESDYAVRRTIEDLEARIAEQEKTIEYYISGQGQGRWA